jgi:hypothetical protein
VFFEGVGWAFGKITKRTATQRIGPEQCLTDVEVDYGDGERRDLACLPSTYGFGDAAPVGSWVIFEPRRGLAEAAHGPDVDMEDAASASLLQENRVDLPAATRKNWRERLRVLCALHSRTVMSSTEVPFNKGSLYKLPAPELRLVAENITAGLEAAPASKTEVIALLLERLELHEHGDRPRQPAQRKQDRRGAKRRRDGKTAFESNKRSEEVIWREIVHSKFLKKITAENFVI